MSVDIEVAEAHDAAMDSLSRSQRNELLANVSMKRAKAKAYTRQVAEGPQAVEKPKRGFWKSVLYWTLWVCGWTLELVGYLYLYSGRGLKWLAEKV